jgi:protein-tyrosine phosphatase
LLAAATVDEATAVAQLRDAAARWLLTNGIRQWRPGEVGGDALRARAEAGELFVARTGGTVAGAVIIGFADPVIWGPDQGEAGYLHGLVIDRRHAGTGLGRAVLAQAEDCLRARNRRLARLDCVAANRRLRAYYEAAGYRQVGERSFDPGSGWYATALLEKTLRTVR